MKVNRVTNLVSINTIRVLLMFLALHLTSCVPTYSTRVTESYRDMWANRLQQYESEYNYKKKLIEEKEQQMFTPDSFPQQISAEALWSELFSRLKRIDDMIFDASIFHGRAEALKNFLSYLRVSPTEGLMYSWFFQKFDELQDAAEKIDKQFNDFINSFDKKAIEGVDWINELRIMAAVRGSLIGMAKEYSLLVKEYTVYSKDIQYARAEEIRGYNAIMQALDRLNESLYRQRLLNAIERPRSCYFLGNMMTCY